MKVEGMRNNRVKLIPDCFKMKLKQSFLDEMHKNEL